MQLRRHKDIIAVRSGAEAPAAFHARNLEVAEISEEMWEHMIPVDFHASKPVEILANLINKEVLEETESWLLEENPEVLDGKVDFGIRSLTINVTQICNLHCTYCAAGGDGSYGDPVKKISVEKTLPQIKFFIDKLQPGQSFHISFLGGEPLLYPEAIQILGEYTREMATAKNISVSFKVTTNGTMINEKTLAAMKAIKSNVVVSIDGPPEINDRVRPQKNKQPVTEKIIEGIRALMANQSELGSIGLHGVFNQDNMEIEKAYGFYLSLNAHWFEFTYAVDAYSESLNKLFMAQMTKVAAKAWARGGEAELRRISNFNHYFKLLDDQRRIENHCGSGKSLLVMDSRNRLYSCPWTVGKASDLMGQDTELNMNQFEPYKDSLVEKNKCGNCWARFLCGGGCMFIHQGKTGHKHTKDPEFCERTRFLVSLTIMYYKRSREASQKNHEVIYG